MGSRVAADRRTACPPALAARLSPGVAGIACALLALAPAFAAQVPPAALSDVPSAPVEEVLVTGEQPGPGMWRVSDGEHELWILGTLDPLPRRMTWRSREAERVIARSQAVIAPPAVSVSVGFFKGLLALPTLLHARTNRGGRTLRDILPAALYDRWAALKERFLDEDDTVEQLRPSVAAHELYKRAIERSGLVSGDGIWSVVEKLAKTQHVPVTAVTIELTVTDPKGTIRELEQIPADGDVACLGSTIETLETGLEPMRRRADLWARGDVDALRQLPAADQRTTCLDAVMAVPKLRTQVLEVRAQLADRWLADVAHALATNQSTLAVLPIAQLLDPDGWVARLRERGYTVDAP